MPNWPTSTAWPTRTAWPAGTAWPATGNWPSDFSGNFASLFPGAYQAVQSDLGLTYGGTPLAAGTTPPVATLSGTLSTVPIPILFKPSTPGVIGSGAVFSAFADGVGVTPFQVGITPVAAGVPVALGGPATGLSIAWAAGTAAADNIWTATCSALADQSGNGKNYTQVTAAKQPILTVGINGKPGLLFDGADDCLNSSLALPAPGTTPCYIFACLKIIAASSNADLVGSLQFGGGPSIRTLTTNGLRPYCGIAAATTTALPIGTFGVVDLGFQNSTADFIRAGSGADVTGVSAGNVVGGTQSIAINGSGTQARVELLSLVYVPGIPGNRAAARAAAAAFYSGIAA